MFDAHRHGWLGVPLLRALLVWRSMVCLMPTNPLINAITRASPIIAAVILSITSPGFTRPGCVDRLVVRPPAWRVWRIRGALCAMAVAPGVVVLKRAVIAHRLVQAAAPYPPVIATGVSQNAPTVALFEIASAFVNTALPAAHCVSGGF